MDIRTLAYYQSHAADAAGRYESGDRSALDALLLEVCPRGACALDVGCGSGRDVAFLRARGVEAVGADASAAMIAEAARRHPEIAPHLRVDSLPSLASLGGERFDAVLATAVFMHLPSGEAAPAARRLAELAAPGGTLVVSVPATPRGRGDDRRDADGRLFEPWSEESLAALFQQAGARPVLAIRRPDACGRPGVEWLTMVLENTSTSTSMNV
jgi:SAM-dependent methyltransferase